MQSMNELVNTILSDITVYNFYTRKAIKKLARLQQRGSYTTEKGTKEFVNVVENAISFINNYVDNLRNNIVIDCDEETITAAARKLLDFYITNQASAEEKIKWVDRNLAELYDGDTYTDCNGNTGIIKFGNEGAVVMIRDKPVPLFEMKHKFDGRQRVLAGERR